MRKKFIEGMRLPLSVMLSLSVALSAVPVQAFADPAPAIEQDVQADEVAAASVEANDETVSIADIKVALGLDVADGDESTQASISDALDLIIGSVNLAEDLPNYTAENNRGLAISMGWSTTTPTLARLPPATSSSRPRTTSASSRPPLTLP